MKSIEVRLVQPKIVEMEPNYKILKLPRHFRKCLHIKGKWLSTLGKAKVDSLKNYVATRGECQQGCL